MSVPKPRESEPRTPIQITAVGMYDPEEQDRFVFLYALCNDATIWRIKPPHGEWIQLPPIPRRSTLP
jgi:hypothetical protein